MSDPATGAGGSPGPPRLLIGLNMTYGAGLLLASRTLLRAPRGTNSGTQARVFARLLGARHLSEALILRRRASPDVILACASIEAIHAASMILLARISPRWRKLALGNATVATMLCAYGIRCGSARR